MFRRSFLTFLGTLPLVRHLGATPQKPSPYVPSFLHPNDRWVVLRGDQGFLFEIVDLETGDLIRRLTDSTTDTYYGRPSFFFDPSGRYLVHANDSVYSPDLRYWDLEKDDPTPRVVSSVPEGKGSLNKDDLPQARLETLPPFTLPRPGGLLRFPLSDLDLRTFRGVARRTQPLDLAALVPDESKERRLQVGRQLWTQRPGGENQSRFEVDKGPGLTVANLPMLWHPYEHSARPGMARRSAGTLLVASGYCTVREVDPATGAVKRVVSGSMPQTGLVAFGSSRNVLYAARPLDMAVRWNRLGKSTQRKGDLQGTITRPPIQEMGEPSTTPEGPRFPREVRVLACSSRGLALGREGGEVSLGHLQDRNGGPWTTLGEQGDAVRALAFAPDLPLLLSGGRDGSLCLWDLEKGKLALRLQEHGARVNAAVIAGKVAATAGPEGVRLWSLPEGKHFGHLTTGGVWVNDLSFGPGGRYLAGALMDGSLRVWELPEGKVAWEAQTPNAGWCAAVAWYPTGDWLASGYELGDLRLWTASDGTPLRRRKVEAQTSWQSGVQPIHALAWSGDGKVLAAGLGDAVRVYDRNLQSAKGDGWVLPLDWADEYT